MGGSTGAGGVRMFEGSSGGAPQTHPRDHDAHRRGARGAQGDGGGARTAGGDDALRASEASPSAPEVTGTVTRVKQPNLLTDSDLDAIEARAKTNVAETHRGPLLALVGEVRRLRGIVLEGAQCEQTEVP